MVVSLPAEGVVESADGKVVVRRLDGSLAGELAALRLDDAASPTQPPRLVAADGRAFRLSGRGLLPDTAARVDRFAGDESPPALPRPPGGRVGHWRYAFASDGTARLAQWSGVCEVPVAYELIRGRPVGLGLSGAPVESVALGLSISGQPVVLFPSTPCGSSRRGRVGVYVRHATGEWQQVTASVTARYFRA
jgi:hypothetical protein